MSHFSQILVVIATSIVDGISHDHPGLPWCKVGFVTAWRSCDVTKGHQNVFFFNSSAQKRATAPCIITLWSAHQDTSTDIRFDLGVTVRSRDLKSTCDLDLMNSSYACIFWCVLTRGFPWCSYFCSSVVSSKVIGKKTPLSSRTAILTFLTPVTPFLTWPNNDLCKNCRSRPPVYNVVYRLSLACFVFEISGGISAPPPNRRYKFGPNPRRCAG